MTPDPNPANASMENVMNRRLLMLLAMMISVVIAAPACVPDVDSEPEETWELEEEKQTLELDGAFLSGHLGNYLDCPGDGYSGDTTNLMEPPEEQDDDADFAAGDCAAESDECSGGFNCEDAQATVRITNDSGEAAEGLQVEKIELFDDDGVSKATLPLLGVENADIRADFDGSVDTEEEVRLRVDFVGPASPYELLRTEDNEPGDDAYYNPTGSLEITFSSEEHKDLIIIGTDIYTVPTVDT